VKPTPKPAANNVDGPHKAAIAALAQPYIDAELVKGLVVGVYDAGAIEIYGFGVGPGGRPPDGSTLFELGAVTRIYTAILLADAVQRREVQLDQPVAELMPAGVAIPTREGAVITLRELANHASGLPKLPPGVLPDAPDPFAEYTEDKLLSDLQHTQLDAKPGTVIGFSDYGSGLLGYALGRKIGGGYAAALTSRVLGPLELHDTFVTVPGDAQARLTSGSSTDLAPANAWHWDALAPAGALVSSAKDQLAVVRAELDAAGNSAGVLRPAMRLTQEDQLEREGDNLGLGHNIDAQGRHWLDGGTAGFHSFISFDPKTKRGVVILASTALSPVVSVAELVYAALDGKTPAPPQFPEPTELAAYAGTYTLALPDKTRVAIALDGRRLYITGANEPRHRLVPLAHAEFWLEELHGVIAFEPDGDKMHMVLLLPTGQRILAERD
jgi:CubicO group peptidase (beta-lactamase class C family)